jgi:hypothetical protein
MSVALIIMAVAMPSKNVDRRGVRDNLLDSAKLHEGIPVEQATWELGRGGDSGEFPARV